MFARQGMRKDGRESIRKHPDETTGEVASPTAQEVCAVANYRGSPKGSELEPSDGVAPGDGEAAGGSRLA